MAGVLREVQRPDLCEAGEAGHHDPAGVAGQHRAGAGRAQGVRHRGGRGLREEGRARHRPLRNQGTKPIVQVSRRTCHQGERARSFIVSKTT